MHAATLSTVRFATIPLSCAASLRSTAAIASPCAENSGAPVQSVPSIDNFQIGKRCFSMASCVSAFTSRAFLQTHTLFCGIAIVPEKRAGVSGGS